MNQVGFDGSQNYSKVVSVHMETARKDLKIYPNPLTNGILYVDYPDTAPGKEWSISVFANRGWCGSVCRCIVDWFPNKPEKTHDE